MSFISILFKPNPFPFRTTLWIIWEAMYLPTLVALARAINDRMKEPCT